VGAAGGPWRQRLRGASRGGDGFFSTFAVRPVSRRMTGFGLAHGWSPNVVTMVSLGLGVLAALLVATGAWWAWVVAAVVLLVALAVDCVDGEIARFTRRFSPLGAFLDAVGDRVKEYAVLAAVASVAVREGSPGWPVALAAMTVVTVRHLEDYAYEARLRPSRRSRPDLLPADAARDLGAEGERTTFGPPPGRRAQAVHWAKKVVHMPIAERYLLIALTLLTRRPMLVLWALFVAVLVAVLWTQGGRVAAVLLRRDPTWTAAEPAAVRGELDEQLDLGPLAMLVGRAVGRTSRPPFLAGLAGALVLVLTSLPLWTGHVGLALVVAVVGSALVAAGWQPPVHDRLGWQAPAALWVAEALAVGVLVHHTLGVQTAAAFAYVAAIAYHRYDVVYRLRDTGTPPAAWLARAGLGTDGRLVALLLLATFAPSAVVPVLWVAAVLLAALYLAESATGWRRWIAAQGEPLPTGTRS
jgi:phosphatidylglycerophosphate synthase